MDMAIGIKCWRAHLPLLFTSLSMTESINLIGKLISGGGTKVSGLSIPVPGTGRIDFKLRLSVQSSTSDHCIRLKSPFRMALGHLNKFMKASSPRRTKGIEKRLQLHTAHTALKELRRRNSLPCTGEIEGGTRCVSTASFYITVLLHVKAAKNRHNNSCFFEPM